MDIEAKGVDQLEGWGTHIALKQKCTLPKMLYISSSSQN